MKYRFQKHWKWLIGAVAVASLVLLSKRSLRGLSVLHLGDSHVGGLRGPLRTLVEASGGRYEAHFKDGISTPEAARSGWGAVVAGAHPDVVIVTLGTNDNPTAATAAAVGALLDQIRAAAPHALIVWWGPPVLLRHDLVELPAAMVALQRPEVAARSGRYVDSRTYTASAEHSAGGVHFTHAGYADWARQLGATFWT